MDRPSQHEQQHTRTVWESPTAPPLSPGQHKQVYALAEALFSTGTGQALAPPPQARLDWLARELDDFLRHAGPRGHALSSLIIFVMSWLPPLLVLSLPPLSRLPLALRVKAVNRAERTPLGLAFYGLKTLLCILYFERDDVLREHGLVRRPLDRVVTIGAAGASPNNPRESQRGAA